MSIIADLQRRSAHIHWPEGIEPEHADLFAHNDIVIAAPAGKIWEHLLRPTAWPDWYSNASDVTVNAPSGLLGAGVVMEETGTGVNPKKLADSNPGHMHRGHDMWNISLKFLCESTRD
jgi:hypothetical protein